MDPLLQWILGGLGALFTGGALLWAKSLHGTLRDVLAEVRKLASSHERIDERTEEIQRRVLRLEGIEDSRSHGGSNGAMA